MRPWWLRWPWRNAYSWLAGFHAGLRMFSGTRRELVELRRERDQLRLFIEGSGGERLDREWT